MDIAAWLRDLGLDRYGTRRCPPWPSGLSGQMRQICTAAPRGSSLRRILRRRGPDVYNWRYQRVWAEKIWPKAIGRIVLDGLSAEAAADEAIERTKQLME